MLGGHFAEAPSAVWAGWKVREGFLGEVTSRLKVKTEWDIEEGRKCCMWKPGGWREWGALDSKISQEKLIWRKVDMQCLVERIVRAGSSRSSSDVGRRDWHDQIFILEKLAVLW